MAEGLQEAVCCSVCQTTSTPVWQRNDDDTIVCLECHSNKKEKNTASNSDTTQLLPKKKKRKTKIERAGRNSNSPLVSTVNKITYRGRRSLAKDIVSLLRVYIISFNHVYLTCTANQISSSQTRDFNYQFCPL